jgi:DNA-binding transcriptional LysR family regulator
MAMEFRTLRAFVEVVRQGGFSQAAKTVFATQSTVSKAVKQLEDEIGTPLLERIGHRTKLTAAGELVYPRAARLLAERADLITELEELRGLKRGRLTLGLPTVGSSLIFAPMFAAYHRRHPHIDVRLVEHGADQIEAELLSGEIEVGASLLPVSDAFAHQALRHEPLMAVMPAGHPLAGQKQVSLTELQPSAFVMFEAGYAINRVISDACRRQGFEPNVAARTSQVEFMLELVAAGLGVAFLPRMLVAELGRSDVVAVRVADADTEWRLVMIWRRGAYLSHAAQAWLALAREFPPAPE